MQQVIYIDVYFLVNFFMNIMLLVMTGRLLKQTNCWYRVGAAAMLGALAACIIFIHNRGQEGGLFGYFLFGMTTLAMVLCAWGKDDGKHLLYKVAGCLMEAYLLGGVLDYFYYHTHLLNQKSLVGWMLAVMILVVALCKIWEWLEKELTKKQYYYKVSIKIGEFMFHGTGFVDTGNHLQDPLSHQPVSVMSIHMLNEKQREEFFQGERFRLIPFSSVGKEKGLMKGIRGDYMCIKREKESNVIKNPILGIYEEDFLGKEKYDILLHPSCISDRK